MAGWGPIALTAVTASLLTLPVAPALFELQKRRDAAPLPVSRHSGQIENFAESFEAKLEPLLPELERCVATNELSRVSIEGLEALIVGRDDFNFASELIGSVSAIMLAHPTVVPAGCIVSADLYAANTLELGEGAMVRAVLSVGDVALRKNSSVLRWLHSRESVRLSPESSVPGRLSAERWITLSNRCRFLRVSAPQILIEDETLSTGASVGPVERNEIRDVGAEYGKTGVKRHRIRGDFFLAAGETLHGDVIATGEVCIGNGAHLVGSIKSYRNVVIDDEASVNGSIVSETFVRVGRHSYIAGPIVAETIAVGRNSRIGHSDSPTTISSAYVQIAAGCQLHGTIWAREQGIIES